MNTDLTVYQFEHGIPGFENLHEFVFTDVGDGLPMRIMKSVEDDEISLLVASPFLFYPEYEWSLHDPSKKELDISNDKDIEIWSIVTVQGDPSRSTINLMAPIVLNTNKKVGKQLILHDTAYSTRAPLIRE